jgi:hypothetical protein
VFEEKLNLVFEFSIFVNADCAVRALTRYVLEKRINRNALHIFLVAFKCLHLCEFVRLDTPDDTCAIEAARDQVL